jgi:peptide/nickel transport system substrate-binding protein
MTDRDYSRRIFLQSAAYAGGGSFLLAACTTSKSAPGAAQTGAAGGALPNVQGGQVITDSAQFPKAFKESPEFAKRVAAGTLPHVSERIGQDPLVIKPLHEIGRYGGTIRRGFLGTGDRQNANRFCAGPDNLLYWDYTGTKVVPNIARDFELSDGDKVLTLHLRRGMKWSDGKPFTADDILFWRDDLNLNDEFGSPSNSLRAGGKNVLIKKVDEYTVQFISAVSNNLLPALMAGWSDISGLTVNGISGGGLYAPKHYLSKFLPKYTSKASANKAARAANFPSWVEYVKDRASWEKNPELPVLSPWIVARPINKPPWAFTANPYSVWVDTSGNQLPYIQTVTMEAAANQDVINLRAAAGQYDFQDRSLAVASMPVLLKNQKRSNYTVYRAPSQVVDFGIRINLAYDKDKVLGNLIRNVDFRRAMSLGIDRDQVNQAFFLGTSKPSATMADQASPYFPGQEWMTKWATHDPNQANALLDKIGLKKDSAGFRQRPDGKGRIRLDYEVGPGFADFAGIGDMIARQWRQIGLELDVQKIDLNLEVQRSVSNGLMLSGHTVGTSDPFALPDTFLPTVTNNYPGMIGIPYAKWFLSDGKSGTEPPASLDLLKEAMRLYRQGLQASEKKRVEIGKRLYKLHADQVWSIGVVGFGLSVYGIYVASNKLGNVPQRMVNTDTMKTPAIGLPMTFYYK